jgi:glycosyltransferase involved in cell wall biosynthesis
MDLSVILCTYNNANRLRITLGSFCRLNPPEGVKWELVTVNNNSTDDTEQVIKSFSDQLPTTYVYEPEQGLSRARNAGLNAAEGDLIVFTDDDVNPDPDWLVAYWEAYQDRPEGYYFGGPIESDFENGPPSEDLLEVAMPSVSGLDYGPDPGGLDSQDIFIGPNWACPSQHLQTETFDEDLGLNASSEGTSVGEETDLMNRLEKKGVEGWYVPRAKINHFVPEEKKKIEHVSKRIISAELKNASKKDEKVKVILGIPIGMYKEYLKKAIKHLYKKLKRGDAPKIYIEKEKWKRRIEIETGKK